MKMRVSSILLLIILTLVTSFFAGKKKLIPSPDRKKIEIRGIYGSPDPFWRKNLRLEQLGVNAIFIHHQSINQSMINKAKTEGLMVFAEFATLNGKNYVEQHPEAWAVDHTGQKVKPATWFLGVCPTEPGFKEYRLKELKQLLQEFDIDGVWMDYLHWHAQFEDPKPILPETCFCENCLSSFRSASKIQIPEGTTSEKAQWVLKNHDRSWRDWRCSVISDWVKNFRSVIKQEKPRALLGVYHCPWDDKDFDGARRRILGLDYDMLRESVDVFSPMVYHKRMGRSPEWVKQNIEWFSRRLNIKTGSLPKIWPIVQSHNDPAIISAEEFEQVLRYGTAARASGVMMFTSHSVAEDSNKLETMKKVYTGWMK